MTRLFKQRFFWQFAGGFLLGSAGMLALQPGIAAAQADVPAYAATR